MKGFRSACFIILMIGSFSLFAQTQQGYVKTKGRLGNNGTVIAGTRLSGAIVSVKGGNSVVSGSNGTFSLAIPSSYYSLQEVQKQGYVLSDPDVLSRQYSYSKNPLVLVLETLEQQADDRLAAERKIRRTLQRQLQEREDEIERLKEQQKLSDAEYRTQLQDLYAQEEINESLISEMADRYSRMDFDEVDEFNRRVSQLILDGKLSEADSLLNTKGDISNRAATLRQHQDANARAEQEIRRRQKKLEKSKELTQKELEDLAQDCYSKFEIFKIQHQNDSASYYIALRASLDTTNVQWAIDEGTYLSVYAANYAESLRVFEDALQRARRQEGENSPQMAALYTDIATVYLTIGRFGEAVDWHQKAIFLKEAIPGIESQTLVSSYNSLAHVYIETGDDVNALLALDKAMEYATGNPSDSAKVLANQANYYYYKGDYPLAREKFEKALVLFTEHSDMENVGISECYNGLSAICSYEDDYEGAIAYCEKAIEIDRQTFGENHPCVVDDYINLASIYNSIGKYAESLTYLEKSLAMEYHFYGEQHPVVASTQNNIAFALAKLGDYDQAVERYQKALSINRSVYGHRHQRVGGILLNLGSLYSETNDFPSALEYTFEALDILTATVGENHAKVSTGYNNIGSIYNEMGDYGKAIEYLEKALAIDLALFGPDHENLASDYNNIGNAYNKLNDYPQAVAYTEKSLSILKKVFGETHPNVAIVYYNLGVLYKKMADYPKALEFAEQSYSILSLIIPEDHPTLKTIRNGIEEIKGLMK